MKSKSLFFIETIGLFILCLCSCKLDNGSDPNPLASLDISDFIPLERPQPQSRFILPVEGKTSVYVGDLQADYPDVDWQTLDRLLIPAGEYSFIQIKNLPQRDPSRPLVITNSGGQVRISGTHYYALSLQGGSGWILSGKYDSDLEIGDAAYPGHAGGNYRSSTGTYGFEIEQVNSSGVSVGGGATHFELEYIEVGDAGFAGLLIKTDNTPDATMDSVSIHDLYIHDTESEGVYIGNTSKNADEQHGFTNLKFYNNRVIRSGTEGPQFSHMGHGVEIYNNVFLMNAVWWKDPFMIYQSGCLQYMTRNGNSSIHHNLFIGGGSALLSLRFLASSADLLHVGDGVDIYENYFSHSRNWVGYIHVDSSNTTSRLRFYDNVIRDINYHLNELPDNAEEEDPAILFRNTNNRRNPLTFLNNTWEGEELFLQWIEGSTGSQTLQEDNTLFQGNHNGTVEPVAFISEVLPDGEQDFSLVESWVAYSDLYNFYVSYKIGDLAIYNGHYYQCTSPLTYSSSFQGEPSGDFEHWRDRGTVTQYDDVRVEPGSAYYEMGLRSF